MRLFVDADLAETIPDGTFGHSRPRARKPARAWTPEEQDAHWADLCETVGTPGRPRPTHTEPP